MSTGGERVYFFFFLNKGLKGAASISTDDLIIQIRRSRNHH